MSQDHTPKPVDRDPYERHASPADPNFEHLINNWSRLQKRLTIFLGAGASVGARNAQGEFLPTAWKLRDDLWRTFLLPDAAKATFDPAQLGMMTLEHAAALAEARAGRQAVEEYLVAKFECPRPLWQHAVLPFLKPKALFTTNYDELIEKGWRLHSGNAAIDDLALRHDAAPVSPAQRVPLFKPHGTLDLASKKIGEGGLVISMFDYFTMIGEYRGMIERFLSNFNQSCVLFVGYAFMDMDIGAELFRLRQERRVPWYAVFPRDDADVRRMYEQRFGIIQINRRAVDFLAELDERVDFIPGEWKFDRVGELRDKSLQ